MPTHTINPYQSDILSQMRTYVATDWISPFPDPAPTQTQPISFGLLRKAVRKALQEAPYNVWEVQQLVEYWAKRIATKGNLPNHDMRTLESIGVVETARQDVKKLLEKLSGDEYFTCAINHRTLAHNDSVVRYNGETYSEAAFADNFSCCVNCNEDFANDSMCSTVHGEYVCEDCYTDEGYFHCTEADAHTSNYCDAEGGCACRARAEGRDLPSPNAGRIHSHSENVLNHCVAFRVTDAEANTANVTPNMYFGIELEVLPRRGVLSRKAASEVGTALAGAAILKHDGSLEDGGFEIVTTPASLAYHREVLWNKFFGDEGARKTNKGRIGELPLAGGENKKEAPAALVKSWSTGCCGLHIHFSRNAVTDMQLGKILVFVHDEKNADFLKIIAGRAMGGRWCRVYKKKLGGKILRDGRGGFAGGELNTANYATHEEREYHHYHAVGISHHTGGKTVEMRIFKGNASRHGVMRALDFTAALIHFCGETSAASVGYKDFLAWFDKPEIRGSYPDLWRQLLSSGLLETEHVFKKLNKRGKLVLDRIANEAIDKDARVASEPAPDDDESENDIWIDDDLDEAMPF